MNADKLADAFRLSLKKNRPEYLRRVRAQTLAWINGRPYHDPVTNECCPDFSCCKPSLFTKDAEQRQREGLEMLRREGADMPPNGQGNGPRE